MRRLDSGGPIRAGSAVASSFRFQHGRRETKFGRQQERRPLNSDHKVGDQTLKASRYSVEHRHHGSGRFIRFKPADQSGDEIATPVVCGLEPSMKNVTQTRIKSVPEGGITLIQRVKAKGNNAAFLFR